MADPAPHLFARLGAALASPGRALRDVDARGTGGVRDAFWLVVLGVLAFRLEDLARSIIAWPHSSTLNVLLRSLSVFSAEIREAAIVVIPAGLAVTVLAGRGRRDPARDIELGALAYVPFFAVRALYRTVDLDAISGGLRPPVRHTATALAATAALVVVALAVRVARARPAQVPPVAPAAVADRIAVTGLAAVLGVGFAVNAAWLARHGDAVLPFKGGSEAPSFTLPRLDQPGSLSLSSLRGKVVLLDFWATWCPPCVAMLPTLHDLHGRWADRGVTMLGVNTEGATASTDELQAFLREHPTPYPVVVDDGRVGALYKVTALPHFVLLDRAGRVAKVYWGYTTRGELERGFEAALAAAP